MKVAEELVVLVQRGCEMSEHNSPQDFYVALVSLVILLVTMLFTLGLYASNQDYQRRILCLKQGNQIVSVGEGITWFCLSNNQKENNE